MSKMKTSFTKHYPVNPSTRIPTKWKRHFDHTAGFAIRLPDRSEVSVLIDKRFPKGGKVTRLRYLKKERILAIVVLCPEIAPWEVRTEPTGPATFGISIYTAKGKAIAAGTGKVLADGAAKFTVATLYDNITNALKITIKIVVGYSSSGHFEVKGSISVSK